MMSYPSYPSILDMQDAYDRAAEALAEMARALVDLRAASADTAPPDGARLSADLAALQAMVADLLSPALRQAIAEAEARGE